MKDFFNTPVIWFIVGFVFFVLEFIMPGFILFFFGVGAWVVAVITLWLDVSINIQILFFLGSTLLTVLLFRKWIREKFGMSKNTPQVLEDELIGKLARAETAISPNNSGKVEFKGAIWDAEADEEIAAGETVTIIGNKSIKLIVKSNKS